MFNFNFYFIFLDQQSQKSLSKSVNVGTIGKYSSQSVRQLETDMVIMAYIARSSSPFTLVDEPSRKWWNI